MKQHTKSLFYLIFDILKLHDRDSNEPVVSKGAIVLDCNVKLVEANGVLVTDHTKVKFDDYLELF